MQKNRRFLVLSVVILTAFVLAMAVSAAEIEISTAEQLMNVTLGDSSVSYIQTADIDLSGVDFKPIGTQKTPFKGVYNGNGYTISGGLISAPGASAIFAYTDGAKIRNLTVSGVTVDAAEFFGGIVAKAGGSTTVSDSTFDGKFVIPSDLTAAAVCGGGIAGWADAKASIENCVSTASLTVEKPQFVVGFGGIAGVNLGMISACENKGNLTTSSEKYLLMLGGIAGENAGEIGGCFNYGELSATVLADGAFAFVGGITGYNNGGNLSRTQNSAPISGIGNGAYPAYVGGIAGYNANGSVRISKNTENISAKDAFAGGIVGVNFGDQGEAALVDCLNSASVSGVNSTTGGLVGDNVTSDSLSSAVSIISSLAPKSGKVSGVEEGNVGTSTVTNVFVNNVAGKSTLDALKSAKSYTGFENEAWIFQQIGILPELVIVKDPTEAEILPAGINTTIGKFAYVVYNPGNAKVASVVVVNKDADGRALNVKIASDVKLNGTYTLLTGEITDKSTGARILPFEDLSKVKPSEAQAADIEF